MSTTSKTKRVLSLLLSLCLIVGMFPTTGVVAKAAEGNVAKNEATKAEYTTVNDAISNAGNGNVITMIDNSEENITVPSDKTVTLDLNGYVLKGDGTTSVITNNGNLTIVDSKPTATHTQEGLKTVTGGVITGGSAEDGGGVYNNGELTIKGGNIAKNEARDGGGVYNKGTLTIKGGSITGNTANSYGGGVYNNGTLEFNGGNITGNTATSGGGVLNECELTITGGNITGNTAEYDGGGVLNECELTITGGNITGNTAEYDGGGVCNKDTLNITGGNITGNTAKNGGGVNNNGTLNITGGNITGNTAKNGGGVDNNGTLNITGGSITNNTASYGAGIANWNSLAIKGGVFDCAEYYDGLSSSNKSKSISNATEIAGDLYIVGQNVEVSNGKVISGTFTFDPSEYVADGYEATESDGTWTVALQKVAQVGEDKYTSIAAALAENDFTNSANPTKIQLIADVEENVTIEVGTYVELDLNGYVLKGDSSNGNASVITNNGNLTITDSNPAANHTQEGLTTVTGGVITGGTGTYEGDCYVGGGVYNNAELTLNGGNIIGNTADYGGGVCNWGTLTISNTAITSNSASEQGGGINNFGTLNLNDGTTVTDNTSDETWLAGGVYSWYDSGYSVNISDKVIIKNNTTKGAPANLCLGNYGQATLGTLVSGTDIGVACLDGSDALISGAFTTNGTADDLQYFTSDNSSYVLKFADDHLEVVIPTIAISGTTAIGQELTAIVDPTTLTGNVTYQWYRGEEAIENATNSTYTLVDADDGTMIKVEMTGSFEKVASEAVEIVLKYVDENKVEQKVEQKIDGGVKVISESSGTAVWGEEGQETWYYITGGTEQEPLSFAGITIQGDVNVILEDGCYLETTGDTRYAGITVSGEGNSLTIYGQSQSSGNLKAEGAFGAAGIGGDAGYSGDNITINGGIVTAIGGASGAGIGGGYLGQANKITINGGTVNVTSTITNADIIAGAGIGGGESSYADGITITGGTVNVTGIDGTISDKIGSGYYYKGRKDSTNISITGGTFNFYVSDLVDRTLYAIVTAENPTTWTVLPAVAVVNDAIGYETVQAAINAATNENDVVKLIVDVTENVSIGSAQNVTLDLNGFVLKGTGSGSVITNSGTLTIKDSNKKAVHYFTVQSGGLWKLTDEIDDEAKNSAIELKADMTSAPAVDAVVKVSGGVITGGNGGGGGIHSENEGTSLTLNNVNIIGNYGNMGAGVLALSGVKLNITDGILAGNVTKHNGGAIYGNTPKEYKLTGTLVMCNQTGEVGGGLAVYNATLNLKDVTVRFNKSVGGTGETLDGYGGGIGIHRQSNTTTKVNISGNTVISDNYAQNYGGGVYATGSDSPITLSGNVVIDNNKCNGTEQNLYLVSDKTVDIGSLTSNANIGVTLANDNGTGTFATNGTENDLQYFTSDNTNYVVDYDETASVLKLVAPTVSINGGAETAVIGNTLTAEVSPASIITGVTYQWYRGDDRITPISTEASYTVTEDDAVQGITVVVTGDGSYKGYAGMATSNTVIITVQCAAPSNLKVTRKTDTSITVAWNTVANAGSYTLEYKPHTATDWVGAAQVMTPSSSCTIENLTANTEYDIRVKANGEGEYYTVSDYTERTAHKYFLQEDFEGGVMPEGWVSDQDGDHVWTVDISECAPALVAERGDYNAQIFTAGDEGKYYLYTPTMDLSECYKADLTFFVKNPAWFGDVDHLNVYYKVGENGDLLEAITEAHESFTQYTIHLPAEALKNNVQIVFEYEGKFGYGVAIDEVEVIDESNKTNLDAPIELAVADEELTSVELSWNAVETASGYEVAYREGTANNDGEWIDLGTTEETFKVVENLTGGVSYEFRVKAITEIHGSSESEWSNTVSITKRSAVARIGETQYVSITRAMWDKPASETEKNPTEIVLIVDTVEDVTIANDRYITLDLNGHVLQGTGSDSVITNNGTLTITDNSTEEQTHKFDTTNALWTLATAETVEKNIATVIGGVITGGTGKYDSSQDDIWTDGDYTENYYYYVGGGVYNSGTLTIENGNITGNAVKYAESHNDNVHSYYIPSGGGVYNKGTLTINGGKIDNNTSGYDGGGVYNCNGTLKIEGGEITGNTAKYGGGVLNDDGELTINGGTIANNTAKYDGGGVYNYYDNDGTLTINGGTIDNNTAECGGGVYNYYDNDGTLTISGSTIIRNTATKDGGGVYNYNRGELTIIGGTIDNNTAEYGGGVYNYNDSELTIIGSTITGNTATDDGGGVYNDYGELTIIGSTIIRNTATKDGGGVYNNDYGELTISGSTIIRNTATKDGGGVYNYDGTLTINNGTMIVRNTAKGNGGGVYNYYYYDGTLMVANSTISGNIASNGAGIFCYGDASITDSEIYGNTAGNTYGGVYVDGTLTVGGKVAIKNNFANKQRSNLCSESPIEFTVDGLLDGSNIWVNEKGPITNGCGEDYFAYFTSDKARYVVSYNETGYYLELVDKGIYHEAVAPTCGKNGNGEYWEYEGKYYSDPECTKELSELSEVVIPATGEHTHDLVWSWSMDAKGEWTASYVDTCSVCKNTLDTKETVTVTKTGDYTYKASVTIGEGTYTETKTLPTISLTASDRTYISQQDGTTKVVLTFQWALPENCTVTSVSINRGYGDDATKPSNPYSINLAGLNNKEDYVNLTLRMTNETSKKTLGAKGCLTYEDENQVLHTVETNLVTVAGLTVN